MKKTALFGFLLLTVVVSFLAYSNHFHNPFEFDDSHTIETNLYIRNVKNIPQFFVDATTTSSLPVSQAYRPGLTTLNAIDYWLAGKEIPDSFMFHVSIFISFLLLGFCIIYFAYALFKSVSSLQLAGIFSVFCGAFFLLHTANSQTINYIIARSDSFSTLMVMFGFVIYLIAPKLRKLHVYMLPVIVGFFVKEPAIMFVPLLMLYKFYFEESVPFEKIFKVEGKVAFIKILKAVLIPLLIVIVLVLFSRKMTPPNWNGGQDAPLFYIISQPYVALHYLNNFILPFNLVIDTDWTRVNRWLDDRVIIGMGFLLFYLYGIYKTYKKHPIFSFGLCWFLIALIPTSVMPLSEVLNDHRPFFGYIGLVISAGYLILKGYEVTIEKYSKYKTSFIFCCVLLLSLHAFGTYRQNNIWSTTESVWREATVIAPNNGRAWMNYGNSQMSKANYSEAEMAYNKAKSLWPDYPSIYVNFGILYSMTNRLIEAEDNFKYAIRLDSINPEYFYYYGNFLFTNVRLTKCKTIVEKGLKLSNQHDGLNKLYAKVQKVMETDPDPAKAKLNIALENVAEFPTKENYINLSLEYYNLKDFKECINACEKALQIDPNYDLAYNNICSSYMELKDWDNAFIAGEKAFKLNPQNELIRNNYEFSKKNKTK